MCAAFGMFGLRLKPRLPLSGYIVKRYILATPALLSPVPTSRLPSVCWVTPAVSGRLFLRIPTAGSSSTLLESMGDERAKQNYANTARSGMGIPVLAGFAADFGRFYWEIYR